MVAELALSLIFMSRCHYSGMNNHRHVDQRASVLAWIVGHWEMRTAAADNLRGGEIFVNYTHSLVSKNRYVLISCSWDISQFAKHTQLVLSDQTVLYLHSPWRMYIIISPTTCSYPIYIFCNICNMSTIVSDWAIYHDLYRDSNKTGWKIWLSL